MADDTPYEITLSMNVVSQIVDAVSPPYDDVSVMAPSSQLENILGYDAHISHPYLKFAGLQFKRPYSMSDPALLNFKINIEQLSTLQKTNSILPGRKAMFYSLPPLKDYTNLSQTLSRTVFVDVEGVRSNTTGIRVPVHRCQSFSSKSSLDAWEKNTGLYEIDPNYVYCWWEFVQGLVYPLLDIPVEYIREWGLSRREPLIDPANPSGWLKFAEDIPSYAFEDPDYERQIGTPLRTPTTLDQNEFDEDSVYDYTDHIESRIKRSEIQGDLSSLAGAVAGADPEQYR